MPNSAHSSATTEPCNKTTESTAKRRRQPSPVHATQRAIRDTAAELRRVDRQLAEIVEHLPQGNGEFDMLAELRGAVDVVRSDLLADAIATLDIAANATESNLRGRFTNPPSKVPTEPAGEPAGRTAPRQESAGRVGEESAIGRVEGGVCLAIFSGHSRSVTVSPS